MGSEDDESRPASFWAEEIAVTRSHMRREMLRWAVAFGLLFGGVFFAFWWSGAALRFGAGRVAETSTPTWRISGQIRDAVSGDPVPWAVIADDPDGRPPFCRAESDYLGKYSLLTFAEPHRIRVSAPGHKPLTVGVGRAWFSWWPNGNETKDLMIFPEP